MGASPVPNETADTPQTAESLRALLEWHVEAGVDLAVDEIAPDRFAEAAAEAEARSVAREAARPAPRTAPAIPAAAQAVPPAPEEAARDARALAANVRTLEDLRALMEAFDGCALKSSAQRLVFSDGTPGARLMLVGEAPGRDEDEQGRPFVGRSGQLLDRMLAAIGLDRTSVYIANIVPWRPPGNRTPTPQEIAICLPFITRQIELAAPDVLVCLGGPSSQTMLGQREGILKLRGRWFDVQAGARRIPALATLHPAYLLRQPVQKRLAWRDLRAIRARLDGGA